MAIRYEENLANKLYMKYHILKWHWISVVINSMVVGAIVRFPWCILTGILYGLWLAFSMSILEKNLKND
jgi:putative effector of murein hydrolase